ncbi:hypothetical protein BDZ94DRAFT_1367666 [Collybia nuda]|uniref:Uncharacterized protein n=1 Tax=Collybia nuda TaxID=64659 RepID=A0A9P5XRI8_9AGAR|nr:hypothetical protein BDZ94DRAFT_1367666 [Collybia nuda]
MSFLKSDGASTHARPIKSGGIWKLASPKEGSEELEELVLRVQGILCKKDLPPLHKPGYIATNRLKYVSQSIALTGLGSSLFQACFDAVYDIHQCISQHFPENSLEDLPQTSHEDYPEITASNRYFTPQHLALSEDLIPFKKCVDPQKILQYAAIGSAFVHTVENEVEYFELKVEDGGSKQYETMNPALFRIGDIVEAQISFLVVPIKNNYHFRVMPILRAITLLDSKFQKDSAILRNRAQKTYIPCDPKPTLKPIILKRKVGYLDDDVEENQKKILKMTIDDESQ